MVDASTTAAERIDYVFVAGRIPESVTIVGWAAPEGFGTWNNGSQATITLRGLAANAIYAGTLSGRPHIAPPALPQQRIDIAANRQQAASAILTQPGAIEFQARTDGAGTLVLDLGLPDSAAPRVLGTSSDGRRLGLLLQRVSLAFERSAPAEETVAEAGSDQILFMQTADSREYRSMLEMTARVNIAYCTAHGMTYESYLGIKRGVAPWQATYNRIFMLNELLDRGFRGWAIFIDADAFVADFTFDLRAYLARHDGCALIGTTGGSATPWDLNAGVLFINFHDDEGRGFVRDWLARFDASIPASYLSRADAEWDEFPNDQTLMYECLKARPQLLARVRKEEAGLFNYNSGSFIKQAIRAGFHDLRDRLRWIGEQTARVMAALAPPPAYVDLTGLANRYGSDKGDTVGNKHNYTQFYQFMFEPFRTEAFDFLEIGLLRGGPEVGGSLERVGGEVPSVAMWLEFFPSAYCHGFDISNFSAVRLPRFRFHRGDQGSPADLDKLRAQLPPLRFIVDDGSHASYHQQLTFSTLFSQVEPGGYYIIEDLDWQPAPIEAAMPKCRLTRDIFLDYMRTGELRIDFLPVPFREALARQIDGVQLVRRRGDGIVKLIAIRKTR